jgi:hypothetical protein
MGKHSHDQAPTADIPELDALWDAYVAARDTYGIDSDTTWTTFFAWWSAN